VKSNNISLEDALMNSGTPVKLRKFIESGYGEFTIKTNR
jgi:hypothetical protein